MNNIQLPEEMIGEILSRLPENEQLPFLNYYPVRHHLRRFLRTKYKVRDLKQSLVRYINHPNPLVVELILRLNPLSRKWINRPLYGDYIDLAALIVATLENSPALVKVLLKWGKARPDIRDMYGRTPLMTACFYGLLDIVQQLLETGNAHPEYQDDDGATALMLVSVRMIPYSEDLNDYEGEILKSTIDQNRIKIVKLLLATGQARIAARDSSGQTALMWAVQRNRPEMVRLLLETGKAHPEYEDNSGHTALYWATGQSRLEELLTDKWRE